VEWDEDSQNVACQPSFEARSSKPKMSLGIPGLGWLQLPSIVLDVGFAGEANSFGCWIGIVEKGSNCIADCDQSWLLEFPNSQDHCNVSVEIYISRMMMARSDKPRKLNFWNKGNSSNQIQTWCLSKEM
jgi:hypothetical protein